MHFSSTHAKHFRELIGGGMHNELPIDALKAMQVEEGEDVIDAVLLEGLGEGPLVALLHQVAGAGAGLSTVPLAEKNVKHKIEK